MSNILNLATSNLITVQQLLTTTGHNIANANNPNYSRQEVSLSTNSPTRIGDSYLGTGVKIDNIFRMSDVFVTKQISTHSSATKRNETYLSHAEPLDKLLVNPDANMMSSLSNFFTALGVANNNPSDSSARSSFLTEAGLMVENFHKMSNQLDSMNRQINEQVTFTVEKINGIADGLVKVNRQIQSQANPPSDLLDQRDKLILELSDYVEVNVVEQPDGSFSVSMGSGQPLIVGNQALKLASGLDPQDPSRQTIFLESSNGARTEIKSDLRGGILGGLIDVQEQVIFPAMNSYGHIAMGLAMKFNEEHITGMTLENNVNQAFFNDMNNGVMQLQRSQASGNNTGTGTLRVAIADVSQLTSSDYVVDVTTGPSYNVTRLSDNTTTNFAGFPINIDGLNITLDSGATNVGDSFRLVPTRYGATNIQMAVEDVKDIALATPIRTSSNNGNTGDGSISPGSVDDITNASFATQGVLSPPLRIEMLSATTYQVVNATTSGVIEGPIAFTPGSKNELFPTPGGYDPGYRISISGTPDQGDSFNIDYNSNGQNDNRNGLRLGEIQNTTFLSGNKMSMSEVFSTMAGAIGGKTGQAKVNMEAHQTLQEQAENKLQSIAGVNLDEEAARLMQYQQSYQAAAQLIKTANLMFDTIFRTMG